MSHSLVNILNADQRHALDNVRATVERIWARPLHRYYTDHTPQGHSARVIALLDGLTAGMMATGKRLAPGEVFVLLAAAYLHDIGMQNEKFAGGDLDDIRDTHHEQTAEMIYAVFEDPANAFPIPLAGDPTVAEAVALVAKGHRRVDLAAAEYAPLVYGEETLRLRLLAALLRFGDELDIDHRRVDMEQIKLLALPEDSLLHWWKCHYVSGVSIQDEYIKITYRFPQSRPDYEGLIVSLVEGDVRARHAELEEIFRANAVKVALGKPQVRLMRLVQPLPPEVEALAREKVEGGKGTRSEQAKERGSAIFLENKVKVESVLNQLPSVHFDLDETGNQAKYTVYLGSKQLGLILVSALGMEFICTVRLPKRFVAEGDMEVEENRLRQWFSEITLMIQHFRGTPAVAEDREKAGGTTDLAPEVKPARPAASPATTLFDQRGQKVGTQINVAGGYVVEQRPAGRGRAGQTEGGGEADARRDVADAATSLRQELAEANTNLGLIRERKAQFVMEVDVPLQLIKEERRLLARIAKLKEELGEPPDC
jgi:hypothetical protein